MTPDDFEMMRDLLKRNSGLVINSEKIYLLESRLTPLARRMGMEGLDALVAKVRSSRDPVLINEVIEAMTTNESFFFRDKKPFDIILNEILPVLYKSRAHTKRLRIWCAAASSGQEPYSLAMLLKEQEHKWHDWSIEILATDISQKILDKARKGLYSQFEVQRGLPIQLLMKYFKEVGEMWQISESIRNMIYYEERNLLEPFTGMGTFDVILCRNVLIYFDQETKTDILNRAYEVIAPDGSLFLGAAETVLGISNRFKPVRGQRGVYSPGGAQESALQALAM